MLAFSFPSHQRSKFTNQELNIFSLAMNFHLGGRVPEFVVKMQGSPVHRVHCTRIQRQNILTISDDTRTCESKTSNLNTLSCWLKFSLISHRWYNSKNKRKICKGVIMISHSKWTLRVRAICRKWKWNQIDWERYNGREAQCHSNRNTPIVLIRNKNYGRTTCH